MKRIPDYYKILGINKNASEEEIRIACERCQSKVMDEKEVLSSRDLTTLSLISDAYETLLDRQKRRQYDFKLTLQEDKLNKTEDKGERKIDESSMSYLKRLYRDIRIEETNKSFSKRHNLVSKKFKKSFKKDNDSLKDAIVFKLGSGTAHIFHETFYQLNKLTYINKESKPKYILRNRRVLGCIVGGTIILGSIFSLNNENGNQEQSIPSTEYVNEEQQTSRITLNRMYEIKFGDTISQIAVDTGVDQFLIERSNSVNPDRIIAGDLLKIPYTIKQKDLEYYTKTVEVEDRSLIEIARENETDAYSIYMLNQESVEKIGKSYVILSDELLVPNFISEKELAVLRETGPNYNK